MLGIYVHLPFCPYICPYCDFAKWPHRETQADRYLTALHAEIDAEACRPAQTVFLGGGTPNMYGSAQIVQLLARLSTRFPGPAERETTIEVNPEIVRKNDLQAYKAAGVTRLSIGVQSFIPSEIRTLGRRHTVEDVQRVVGQARQARIESLSLDLIFAVPGQTAASWRRSLEAAIGCGVDHIAAYGLTIEPGTPYAAWRDRDPDAFADDVLEAELYGTAIEMLERAGFAQYEISNFARGGHRCRHNENYWENGQYIGLGVGAASYRDGVRSVHTRNFEEYVTASVTGGRIPSECEQLESLRRAGEAVMLALRTSQGVSFTKFKESYGLDFLTHYAPIVRRYQEEGLLTTDGTHARLTRRGRFFANDVCADFVTLA